MLVQPVAVVKFNWGIFLAQYNLQWSPGHKQATKIWLYEWGGRIIGLLSIRKCLTELLFTQEKSGCDKVACVAKVPVLSERNSGLVNSGQVGHPLPHSLPSTFLLLPHVSHGPNAKNSFSWPEFCSLRTGTLATQASQAFWYYAMVRFHTIDLKSHPIAQFTKNRIIHKRSHIIHKINHK